MCAGQVIICAYGEPGDEAQGSVMAAVAQLLESIGIPLEKRNYYKGSSWLFAETLNMPAGVDLSLALMEAVDAGIAADSKVLVQVGFFGNESGPYQLVRSPGVGSCL